MAVSVTERTFFERRITSLIDGKIKEIHAQHPSYKAQVHTKACAEATTKLAMSPQMLVLKGLDATLQRAYNAALDKAAEIYSKLNGITKEEAMDSYNVKDHRCTYYESAQEWLESAIKENASSFEDKIMARDPIGKKILKYKAERDRVTEAVYLATSNEKLVLLYVAVAKILGEKIEDSEIVKLAQSVR